MATPRSGQLDQISQAIGALQGSFEAIERYMHDREHGMNNLSQKVEALGVRIAKDIAAVEGRIEGRIKAMDDRVVKLEATAAADRRQRNIVAIIVQSPLIGWVVGAFAFVWAMLTHGGQR
jgi:hypothetical protein